MSRRAQKNVGVIGLGIIGSRVAENLRRRGFQVFVWNRTPKPVSNFVGSVREVAELCDFIEIFVADDEALLEMVRQMAPELGAYHVVLAHSTVAPATMRMAAEMVKRRGAEFLDAPFTGSKIAAEKGELVYYVAGDDLALRRARPVLEASGKEIVELGEIGQATTIKIATNMVTAATVHVAAEALALVHKSGIASEKFIAALRSNASHSGTLGLKVPKMVAGEFDPHFSVKHMLKDVRIAHRLADSLDLSMPVTKETRAGLEEELRQGHGDEDFSAVARRYFADGELVKRAHPDLTGSDTEEFIVMKTQSGAPEPAAAKSTPGTPAVEAAPEPAPVAKEQTAPSKPELAPAEERSGLFARFRRRAADE